MKKISEILIDVSAEFLTSQNQKDEVEARLGIVIAAWNISILPKNKRKSSINRYVRHVSSHAPRKEDLESRRNEINLIINRKIKLYPGVRNMVENAEVIESADEFVIRAYYKNTNGNKAEFIA